MNMKRHQINILLNFEKLLNSLNLRNIIIEGAGYETYNINLYK